MLWNMQDVVTTRAAVLKIVAKVFLPDEEKAKCKAFFFSM
jgi:hypothetical protein